MKLLILILLLTSRVYGFSCEWRPYEKEVKYSKSIFSGKVISQAKDSAVIQVSQVYLGKLGSKVEVSFDKKLAKIYNGINFFEVGKEVVVMSSYDVEGEKLILHGCDHKSYTSASQDLTARLKKDFHK